MRITGAAFGLVLVLAGAGSASAQSSLSAGLTSMGGVGISRHGTGFSGTLGDPDYYVAGSDLPESEGHYPGPYGTMGTAAGARYTGPAPAMQYIPSRQYPPMQYNWTNPYAR